MGSMHSVSENSSFPGVAVKKVLHGTNIDLIILLMYDMRQFCAFVVPRKIQETNKVLLKQGSR